MIRGCVLLLMLVLTPVFCVDGYKNHFESHSQNRHYDPSLGRFLQLDPARAGNNWYAYSSGDPVNYWDPSGLAGYFFDGTGNHPLKKNVDGTPNYQTNTYILYVAYTGGEAFYMPGIGTGFGPQAVSRSENLNSNSSSWIGRKYEGGTGATMTDRVDAMMDRFEEQVEKGDYDVDVFGFSRGSATAVRFLHKVQEKIKTGGKYSDVNVRYVALQDSVPTDRHLIPQLGGELFDAAAFLGTAGIWDHDAYAEVANMVENQLPQEMAFQFSPLHLVSVDERRKQFAVTDLGQGDQIGIRGVHSDGGGGYGGNLFEYIARQEILERAANFGLAIFDKSLAERIAKGNYSKERAAGAYERDASVYRNFKNKFSSYVYSESYSNMKSFLKSNKNAGAGLFLLPDKPTDNVSWSFYNNENRHFPENLRLHPSVFWFDTDPINLFDD